MPLFGSKKKNEFSGRPDATTADDTAYTQRSSTLHKRNAGTDPIDTRATQQPGYGQSGLNRDQPGYNNATGLNSTNAANNDIDARNINDSPSTMGRKKRGGLFGRRRNSSRSSSSDEGRYMSSQNTGSGTMATGVGAAGAGGMMAHNRGHGFNDQTMNNGLQPYNGDDMGLAREKVHAAEAAEREALRMLGAARSAVKEAKEHIDRLAQTADEECVVFIFCHHAL